MDDLPINGKQVALGIAVNLNAIPPHNFSFGHLNRAERELVDQVTGMIRSAERGQSPSEQRQDIDDDVRPETSREDEDIRDPDPDWDYEEEEGEEKEKKKSEKPTREMFDRALAYYREGSKRNRNGQGVRSLGSMKSKFRWIRSQAVLDSIVRYETSGDFPSNRNEHMHKLAEDLNEEVVGLLAEGRELHDRDIKEMALAINKRDRLWAPFTASDSWVDRWKRQYKITTKTSNENTSSENKNKRKKIV